MNMPGFTAEISLYKTHALYQAAMKGVQTNGAVYPAQSAIGFPGLPPWAVDPNPPNPLGLYCWRCGWRSVWDKKSMQVIEEFTCRRELC